MDWPCQPRKCKKKKNEIFLDDNPKNNKAVNHNQFPLLGYIISEGKQEKLPYNIKIPKHMVSISYLLLKLPYFLPLKNCW